jgi:hypothetical protein
VKVLPPAILGLEALVVALSIPVAATSRGATAAWVLAVIALALFLAAGMARSPRGVAIGWVLQGAVLASGLLVPAMFVLGLIFLAIWITALVYGAKADRLAARNRALAAQERAAAAQEPSGQPPGDG